ncbi:hypothetical protein ZIOFF_031125 [Zingiber officinale]|uniref:Uncharacterized protein n=1 Tax=Zingiber officinale TaxID=94328 RepID=A0A8J5LCC6_ZINOF|nr:hypothetical protein ZIOFF_031125 [Zingiber officinale]
MLHPGECSETPICFVTLYEKCDFRAAKQLTCHCKSSVEDSLVYREGSTWFPPFCSWFRPLQPDCLHPNDYRGTIGIGLLLKMMKKRHKVERDINISDEVGVSKNMEAAKSNAQLKSMNKKFGMIHGLSSLANLMASGSLAIHSRYLAGKLHF